MIHFDVCAIEKLLTGCREAIDSAAEHGAVFDANEVARCYETVSDATRQASQLASKVVCQLLQHEYPAIDESDPRWLLHRDRVAGSVSADSEFDRGARAMLLLLRVPVATHEQAIERARAGETGGEEWKATEAQRIEEMACRLVVELMHDVVTAAKAGKTPAHALNLVLSYAEGNVPETLARRLAQTLVDGRESDLSDLDDLHGEQLDAVGREVDLARSDGEHDDRYRERVWMALDEKGMTE